MASIMKQATNICLNPNASLGIDQACFSIINKYKHNLTFYSTFSECRLCRGIPTTNLSAESNTTLLVSTKYPLHMYYMSNHYEWCHTTYAFKEHGSYGWNLSAENICSNVYIINEPSDAYFPLLAALMILIISIIVMQIGKVIVRAIKYYFWKNTTFIHDDLTRLQESESPIPAAMNITRLSTRIQSIDTFRGIAILLMIFVNNGGGKYVFFNHSAWFGLTVADLVLPWFAWIMGLTIAISKRAELRNTSSRSKIILRNFTRSLILIFFGLMINSQKSEYLQDLRFPGVLQLLAISYFVCAVIETIFMKSHIQFERFFILGDILQNWIQWLIILTIVAAHTLITFLLPVPNCPKGYLGPGGYDTFKKYMNCTGGAAGYIDRYVFGNHMYSQTKNPVYGVILQHDPEGIMNTISAIFIVYLGIHAGKILLYYYQCSSKVLRWLLWSLIMGIIAGVLCDFSKEDGIIPLSKKMMTISFVLTTCSFAFLLFAILYYLIDYKQFWTGAPFIYAGANSIFLYIGHTVTMGLFPWSWKENYPTHSTQLIINLWTTTLWLFISYILYKKDIVITV
ncbi:heparan-alpha-glucosaminide N-acetyltransferase-like [Vespa mandarinia]|uniref:heparan-alpha-glucosaminide N-acetyltransferase-like n=1 Tax=Vespa mandarinia TaxID=7446 RepID=UPI00162123DD|nr:heparan-alpha-glucosaminide N-acetyltransferase-like [Vespa mandarinia]XP_035731757.1 heparan-alpha-glucosaminide N-acetyltransferase-like [Vespa mandarinia]